MARAYQLFYYSTLGWEYKESQIGIVFCFAVYSVTGLLTKTLKNTVKKNTVPAVGDGQQYGRGGYQKQADSMANVGLLSEERNE